MKKYQTRRSNWVGIGKLADSDKWMDEAVVIKCPWGPSDEMERIVTDCLPPTPDQN